jgi:hypothetical protein
VREVVDHLDAARTTEHLEAAADALEARERRRHVVQRYAQHTAARDRRERVLHVVHTGHRQMEAHA